MAAPSKKRLNRYLITNPDFPIDFKKKDSTENDTRVNKMSEYKRAAEKMREDVNNLKNYFSKYGDEGDN